MFVIQRPNTWQVQERLKILSVYVECCHAYIHKVLHMGLSGAKKKAEHNEPKNARYVKCDLNFKGFGGSIQTRVYENHDNAWYPIGYVFLLRCFILGLKNIPRIRNQISNKNKISVQ